MPRKTQKERPASPDGSAKPPGRLLNDHAYGAIRQAITSLRLKPGQSVSVGTLASWLRISRTPIRDALQRLQHDGLIRSLPRRGLVVAQLTPDAAGELYELQEALEAMAARLAAERASPQERKRLIQVSRKMAAVAHDAAAWTEVDTAYHVLLCAAAHSASIARLLGSLAPQLLRFRALAALSKPDRPKRSAREHLAVARAVANGDGVAAMSLTHAHWSLVRAEVIENLRRYAALGGILGDSEKADLGPSPVV